MNDSIKRISLDVHSTSSSECVNIKRGDTGRKINISLVDGGMPYIIAEDCYAVFTAQKPDGNVVYNDCTIENNTIVYAVTEQTTAVEGRVSSEIKLYGNGGKLITSPKFTIHVFGTVYNEGDEIESTDEYTALTKLVGDALAATEKANEAVQKAEGVDASTPVIIRVKRDEETDELWLEDNNLSDLIQATENNVPVVINVEEGKNEAGGNVVTSYYLNKYTYFPGLDEHNWDFVYSDDKSTKTLSIDNWGYGHEEVDSYIAGPGSHNSIYRGKFLGYRVLGHQYDQIKNGTFDNMYIGDYWEIGGVRYRIAAFDYYSGDMVNEPYRGQLHHVTIVPDCMSSKTYKMMENGGVSNGYVNSDIGVVHLKDCLQVALSAFGKGHLMCCHNMLVTAFDKSTNRFSSTATWRFIDLMNEQMVYGSRINGMTVPEQFNSLATADKNILPLFLYRPDLIVSIDHKTPTSLYTQGTRYGYWLRDIASPKGFCKVSANGVASASVSTELLTIRPVFSIVADNSGDVAKRSEQATYEDYGLEV